METNVLESLRNYSSTTDFARRAFEILAQRQRKRTELSVDVLMRDMGSPRADVVKFFKQLGEFGCGRFYSGRGSKPSRFRWRYAMYSVAQVALGQAQMLEELPLEGGDEDEEPAYTTTSESPPSIRTDTVIAPSAVPAAAPPRSKVINHTYPLRPDLLVPMVLPADLTAPEAERLAAFIRALAVTSINIGSSSVK